METIRNLNRINHSSERNPGRKQAGILNQINRSSEGNPGRKENAQWKTNICLFFIL
jgi:hypothetical protein